MLQRPPSKNPRSRALYPLWNESRDGLPDLLVGPLRDGFIEHLRDVADWLRCADSKYEPTGIMREIVPSGPIEGGIKVELWRGPRLGGGKRRFFLDLNRMARALADSLKKEWEDTHPGQRKVIYRGAKITVRAAAIRDAVAWVKRHYGSLPGCIPADVDTISASWDHHGPAASWPD
jgi:hypothetical protein